MRAPLRKRPLGWDLVPMFWSADRTKRLRFNPCQFKDRLAGVAVGFAELQLRSVH